MQIYTITLYGEPKMGNDQDRETGARLQHTTRRKVPKWVLLLLRIAAYRILDANVSLPFPVGNPRAYHFREWRSVYLALKKQGMNLEAIYFVITRPCDAIAINRRFGHRENGKLKPSHTPR